MSNESKLSEEICNLSKSKNWISAKLEWDLEDIYQQIEPEVCLCGHYPINEICVLRNRINGNFATVGNICVKKFLGLPSDKLFQSIKKVKKDDSKSFNEIVVEFIFTKGWINEWEKNFYLDIYLKRVLTDKQLNKKIAINRKILPKIVNAKP